MHIWWVLNSLSRYVKNFQGFCWHVNLCNLSLRWRLHKGKATSLKFKHLPNLLHHQRKWISHIHIHRKLHNKHGKGGSKICHNFSVHHLWIIITLYKEGGESLAIKRTHILQWESVLNYCNLFSITKSTHWMTIHPMNIDLYCVQTSFISCCAFSFSFFL